MSVKQALSLCLDLAVAAGLFVLAIWSVLWIHSQQVSNHMAYVVFYVAALVTTALGVTLCLHVLRILHRDTPVSAMVSTAAREYFQPITGAGAYRVERVQQHDGSTITSLEQSVESVFGLPDRDYSCGAAFCDDPACNTHGAKDRDDNLLYWQKRDVLPRS